MLSENQTFSGANRRFAIAAILLIIVISWLSVIDRKAEEYVDESTLQALGIFGTLRLANATISVVKSVEVDAFFASVQFGQVLDPVDDLIEDASSVLKFALGSLFTQKILVEIASTQFFKILITASGLLLIASLYIQNGRFSGFLLKMFALVGLARFLFVLVIFFNGLVDQAFVDEKTSAEQEKLKGASQGIAAVGQTAQQDESDPETVLIREQIEELTDQRKMVVQAIESTRAEVASAQESLEESELELSEIKESLDLKERYFSENAEYEKQKARVERREQALSDSVSLLDDYTERLEEFDEQLEDLNAELAGGGQGFFAATKEMMDFDKMKAKAEQLIDSTLKLMALLTLKGLIIPVIFLVLLLKGFRYIWGVDARTLGAKAWGGAKDELNRSA